MDAQHKCLLGAAVLSTVLSAPQAFATTYYCDNDPDPSQYPGCSTWAGSDVFVYRSGQSGDWNGDDRLDPAGGRWAGYGWIFAHIHPYRYYAWLANDAFTASAEYSYYNQAAHQFGSLRTLNQNTAPGGWNYLGKGTGNAVQMMRNYSRGGLGADVVKAVTISTVGNGQSAADDEMDPSALNPFSRCESLAIRDPAIAAIQQKMLDAVDYYRDIRGSFRISFSNNSQGDNVAFEISEQNRSSLVKITDTTGNPTTHVSNGQSAMTYFPSESKFQTSSLAETEAPATGPRFYRNAKCEPVYLHRDDPAGATGANEVTLPQNYAFWLTTATSKSAGHDYVVGRQATVIEGHPDAYLTRKLGASTFKMWVDDKTGVLLKLIGTDDKSKQVYSIEMLNVQFDTGTVKVPAISTPPADWTAITRQ